MPPFRSPLFVFCSHHPQLPNPRARTPVHSMSEALIAPLRSSLGRRGHRRRPQEGSNAASEAPGGKPMARFPRSFSASPGLCQTHSDPAQPRGFHKQAPSFFRATALSWTLSLCQLSGGSL